MADVSTHSTLPTGLVSLWEFEEASGTRVDSHGSNDLTDGNTVGQGTGKQGDCADFEAGNTEYLSITDASQSGLDFTSDFSISLWANFESLTGDHFLVCKGDVNAGTRDVAYYLWPNANGRVDLRVSDDGTLTTGHNKSIRTADNAVTTTGWYHIVATWDASAADGSIYINGSDATSTTNGTVGTSVNNSTDAFYIGARESNGSATSTFDGLMDEVGVWSRVLTSGEVSDLYNSGDGLPYAESGSYTLTADTVAFTLTGVAADLTLGRTLTAETGSFTLTGLDATLSTTASSNGWEPQSKSSASTLTPGTKSSAPTWTPNNKS